jgi:hypothetical protein
MTKTKTPFRAARDAGLYPPAPPPAPPGVGIPENGGGSGGIVPGQERPYHRVESERSRDSKRPGLLGRLRIVR